jgi:5-methylcytosine-specific restriction endonuclease McrA
LDSESITASMAVREMPCGERVNWTKEADELISQRHLTAKELAETLGITPHAVYNRRSKIGVRFWKETKPTKGRTSKYPASLKLIKRWVLQRDNYTCAYCGDLGLEVDHVIPRMHGGRDIPSNLVASCSRCNNLKGTSCAECPNWRKQIESA